MPPPTREQVNALIAKLTNFHVYDICSAAREVLTALQAENDQLAKELQMQDEANDLLTSENDRLRAQASPAWVVLSERKPTKEDLPYIWSNERGNVFYADLSTPWCDTGSWAIIHWMRVSPCPPPESAADRQRREDEEAWKAYSDTVSRYSVGMARNDFFAGIAHARKEATP